MKSPHLTGNRDDLTLNQEESLFGPRFALILNNFFPIKPIKLQLSVPSELLLRIILLIFFVIANVLKL